MVSNIHRTMVEDREGNVDKNLLVSDTQTVPINNCILIPAQAQTRSAFSTADGSGISYLHLAYSVNYLPRRQEPASVVAS